MIWKKKDLEAYCPYEIRGKSFKDVYDNNLGFFRKYIAHLYIKNTKIFLNMDDLQHRQFANYWLPVVKIMVRRMLKNEFPNEFLLFIDETGNLKQE